MQHTRWQNMLFMTGLEDPPLLLTTIDVLGISV